MKEEVKKLSSGKIKIDSDLIVGEHLFRPYTGRYGQDYEYDYYKVLFQDDEVYKIDSDEYDRIFKAIAAGAKFVSINEDLININFIRAFQKATGYGSGRPGRTIEEIAMGIK